MTSGTISTMRAAVVTAGTPTGSTRVTPSFTTRNATGSTFTPAVLAPPNMGDDYGKRFNAIYPRLAEKYGLPLYPFVLDGVITDRSLLLEDGMHPNTKGLQIMAERLAPLAESWVKGIKGQ